MAQLIVTDAPIEGKIFDSSADARKWCDRKSGGGKFYIYSAVELGRVVETTMVPKSTVVAGTLVSPRPNAKGPKGPKGAEGAKGPTK